MAGNNQINFADTIAQWVTKANNLDSDFGLRTSLNTTTKLDLVSAVNEINTTLVNQAAAALDSAKTIALFSDTATINFDSGGPRMTVQSQSIDQTHIKDSCLTAKSFKNHVKIDIKNSSGTVLARLWSPDSPGG